MQKTSNQKVIQIQRLLAISLSFFSLLFFCNSCYEPIEGCLDINSSNYLVSADGACDSCCVFPDFKLNIDQVFNGEDFSLGDSLINDLEVQFKITDYLMIFSGFSLKAGDDTFTVADSTIVNCNGAINNYEINDLISVNSSTSSKTIGEWKQPGSIDNISFMLGLNDCYQDAGISNLSDENRIADIDTLYRSGEGFRTFILEVNDTLKYEFVGKSENIEFSKAIIGSNAAGTTLFINMNIDFGVWLADFSFDDETLATKTKLIQNFNEAITFTQ